MRSGQTARVRFDILAVMLVLCTLVPIAWAQTENTPGPPVGPETDAPTMPWVGESSAELIVILLSIGVLVLVAGTKAIHHKRKREDEAVRLQAQISDALLRDPTLASLPVAPTVHFPVWRRSPARIEMYGQIPTAELRQAVLHVAEEEASRLLAAFHIHDRMAIVPSARARAA
jgi:hypothetical protein